jgi:uncharacterized protein (DUF433 family)
MGTPRDMLKPTEAAVVAHVAVRDINRIFDEDIFPSEIFSSLFDDNRRVSAIGCGLISFYFETALRLTAAERLSVVREVSERLSTEVMHTPLKRALAAMKAEKRLWMVKDECLTVDLSPFFRGVAERLNRLSAARDLVVSDPDILDGMPVIRGTRIPVYDVAASVKAGIPFERILAAYPSLDRDKVELAALYAEANPARGRPRSSDTLPKGAVIVSDRRVPRRRKAT